MSDKNSEIAEVFDFSQYKLESMILESKRNTKTPQAVINTLEAVLDLYKTKCITISWVKGEPYMALCPGVDLDEESLKEKFNQIIAGI